MMTVDQLHASIAQDTGYDGVPDDVAETPSSAADNPHAEETADDEGETAEEAPDRAVEAVTSR
jgi:hypothetical protein